jgi:hypothetical protein
MATTDTGNNLSQKGAHRRQGQTHALANILRLLVLIHKGLEIVRDEFKDQVESAWMGLNDIQQLDLRGGEKQRTKENRQDMSRLDSLKT